MKTKTDAKKSKPGKPSKLKEETVRELTEEQLNSVQGGRNGTPAPRKISKI
jgi:bacteriocin-like protein